MSVQVIERLQARFGDAILATSNYRGDAAVTIAPEHNVEVLTFLRDDPELQFDLGVDLCGVDWLGLPEGSRRTRFEVVYHLYSIPRRHRLRVKCPLPDDDKPSLRSVMDVYRGFDWYERETFDMFGIVFVGHPSLKRMFMYDQFQGHPLRKDFPQERRFPLARREGL